jgi:hypothetical protein
MSSSSSGGSIGSIASGSSNSISSNNIITNIRSIDSMKSSIIGRNRTHYISIRSINIGRSSTSRI